MTMLFSEFFTPTWGEMKFYETTWGEGRWVANKTQTIKQASAGVAVYGEGL